MEYAHPEVLVDTNWVDQHKNDPKVRVAEVDYDPTANYTLGHVPGSVLIDWKADINDPLTRNILTKQACESLLQRVGVNDDTTLVLYGDFNNWFAAFAFWVFKYYGYKDVRLMNGGFESSILVYGLCPRDVNCTRDMSTSLGMFRWVFWRRQNFTGKFLRTSDVDQYFAAQSVPNVP